MRRSNRFVRTPSLLEQLYLDGACLGYNLTPRAYIKIDRAPKKSMIADALSRLAEHLPVLNLCYRKTVWNRTGLPLPLHWIESDCLDVMQVSVPAVDWRTHTLSLSVIHLRQTDAWYLCFSMFHGIGDGYTLTHLIYAFFAAMDQRLSAQYDFSLTEHDFPQQTLKKSYRFPVGLTCEPTMVGRPEADFHLVRTEAAPYIPTATLCSCALPFLKDRRSAMVIPVNMRRYCAPGEGFRMGNLMAPMFLNTAGNSAAQIRNDIHANVNEANLPIFSRAAAQFYRAIPGVLRRFALRCYAAAIRRRGKTPMAAMVSNVGKVHPDALRCAAFHGEDCWYAFENIPLFAITLLTVSFGEHTNTCISTQYSTISNQAVQSIANSIASMDIYAPLA